MMFTSSVSVIYSLLSQGKEKRIETGLLFLLQSHAMQTFATRCQYNPWNVHESAAYWSCLTDVVFLDWPGAFQTLFVLSVLITQNFMINFFLVVPAYIHLIPSL